MSDLISRQAAIDALARTAREKFNLSDEFGHYLAGLMDGENAIRQLPSAQPEIIRCKDCRHVGTDATCCFVCTRVGMGLKPYHVYPDDFCSYAERRTDD